MFDFFLGLGQGGSRIAKEFSNVYAVPASYINLTDVDFSKFDANRKDIFIIEEGGSGRDPNFGEKVVRHRWSEIKKFVDEKITPGQELIAICVGGGGGSGAGLMLPIIEYLSTKKKKVFLVYTLPCKTEGVPVQPNALKSLDRLISKGYVNARNSGTLLVDNDFCIAKYGSPSRTDFWQSVNVGIASALKRLYLLTNLDHHKNYVDVTAGFKALDARELERIVYFGEGFCDIREASFDSPMFPETIRPVLKTSSLVNYDMNMSSAKSFILSVAIPSEWKNRKGTTEWLENVFLAVDSSTKTPYGIKSSYYSQRIKTAKVTLFLAGMIKGKSIDRQIKTATKNVEKFNSKRIELDLGIKDFDF